MGGIIPDRNAASGNIVMEHAPFATKEMAGKKLYKRVTGIQAAVTTGSNEIVFTVTYPWVKLTQIEIVNCEALDKACLKVFDDANGTYSGTPNYEFNQFGFTVNCSKDFYKSASEFDSDLYVGMKIKVNYQSLSNKTIGINLVQNEVK